MRVVVLGASGMLGNAMFRVLRADQSLKTFGLSRTSIKAFFTDEDHPYIYEGIELTDLGILTPLLETLKPDVIINCIGLIKQLPTASDSILAISINALFPHQLAKLSKEVGARLIHFSTDCVFSGSKGNYSETDHADAEDLYGRSKFLGEVDYPHALTLRTSIIGHELITNRSLLGWFLQQKETITGYCNAIFSGLPTVELATIIRDIILPNPSLTGVYHAAADPISKYELLLLIARVYQKNLRIVPDDHFILDRSLNAERFYQATGYRAPTWETLIETMHQHFYLGEKRV